MSRESRHRGTAVIRPVIIPSTRPVHLRQRTPLCRLVWTPGIERAPIYRRSDPRPTVLAPTLRAMSCQRSVGARRFLLLPGADI